MIDQLREGSAAARRVFAALAIVLWGALALPANAQEGPLPGDQVRTLLIGNTITGPLDASPYEFSYTSETEVIGTAGASTDSGTWKIRDENVYCHEWSTYFGGYERCYQWFDTGKGRYLLKNVDSFRVRDLEVWTTRPGID